jgi:molybdopterin-guanine dinucleotide biosynthesis protein A
VVLAGGGGVRLGGVDKASIELDGESLLERALAATSAAEEAVVVGTQVPTSRPVTWTREDPPGGGPAAGLLAGLDALHSPPQMVVVLAVDMPRVTAATVSRLVDVLSGDAAADGACLVDDARRRQPLAAVYRYAALVGARPADPDAEHGLPIRRLVAALRLTDVPSRGAEARDVDTWEDLRDLRP